MGDSLAGGGGGDCASHQGESQKDQKDQVESGNKGCGKARLAHESSFLREHPKDFLPIIDEIARKSQVFFPAFSPGLRSVSELVMIGFASDYH